MSFFKPATIAERLDQQINARLLVMTNFISDDDFQLLRLEDETRKLIGVNPAGAWRNLAIISHMRGDIDAFEQHMRNAENLSNDSVNDGLTRLCAYSNLAFATKALAFYRQCVDIKYQNLGLAAIYGASFGAFQHIHHLMTQAQAAEIELPFPEQMANLDQAAKFLKEHGISDDLCARVVDAAGEVLRSRKLFWCDEYPQISVNDEDGTVSMRMRVDTSPQEASSMTMETAGKLISQDLDTLPFYVSFIGTQA